MRCSFDLASVSFASRLAIGRRITRGRARSWFWAVFRPAASRLVDWKAAHRFVTIRGARLGMDLEVELGCPMLLRAMSGQLPDLE